MVPGEGKAEAKKLANWLIWITNKIKVVFRMCSTQKVVTLQGTWVLEVKVNIVWHFSDNNKNPCVDATVSSLFCAGFGGSNRVFP